MPIQPLFYGENLNNSNTGPNIRRLRSLHDMKQEYLAKRLGISRQMLHNYENNAYPVPETIIKKVADLFEINCGILSLSNIALLIK